MAGGPLIQSRHPPFVGSAAASILLLDDSGAAHSPGGVHCAADGSGSSAILHCSAS